MLVDLFEAIELIGCLNATFGEVASATREGVREELAESRRKRRLREARVRSVLATAVEFETVDGGTGTLATDQSVGRFALALGDQLAIAFDPAEVRRAEPLASAPTVIALQVETPQGLWHRTLRFDTAKAAKRWQRRFLSKRSRF